MMSMICFFQPLQQHLTEESLGFPYAEMLKKKPIKTIKNITIRKEPRLKASKIIKS